MNSKINQRLIYRYLADECTAGEKLIVQKWLESDPANREAVAALQKIWQVEPKKEIEPDIKLAWERIEKQLVRPEIDIPVSLRQKNQNEFFTDQRRRRESGLGNNSIWLRAAAILLVAGFTALFGILWAPQMDTTEEPSMKEVVTESGQRAQVLLDDGTRVWLNSASRIEYPEKFHSETRTVHLSGEAYFEVMPGERPFFVYADEAVVRIVGTKFNVQAYEENVEVVVAEGKVAVGFSDTRGMEESLLEKGDMAEIPRQGDGRISVTRQADLQRHLGWLEYRLEFDAAPLEKVAKVLERWYKMDIQFSDPSISDLRFTAVFEDESVYEILQALKLSLDLEYEIEDRNVVFYPGSE